MAGALMFRLASTQAPQTKLEQRLRALPPHQLQGWADAYLNEVGQYLLLHNREGGHEALDLAEESATALLATVKELRRRA